MSMLSNYQLIIISLGGAAVINLILIGGVWLVFRKRLKEARRSPAHAALNPAAVKQLEEKALRQLEWRVSTAIKDFDSELSETTGVLNKKLAGLVATVIEREMTAYKTELQKARENAVNNLSQVQAAADELQQKQRDQMAAELESEKQRLLTALDQRLSDVLSSYLIESLGQEIDLGAQSKYLLATLDKNKEQLKKDILDG